MYEKLKEENMLLKDYSSELEEITEDFDKTLNMKLDVNKFLFDTILMMTKPEMEDRPSASQIVKKIKEFLTKNPCEGIDKAQYIASFIHNPLTFTHPALD